MNTQQASKIVISVRQRLQLSTNGMTENALMNLILDLQKVEDYFLEEEISKRNIESILVDVAIEVIKDEAEGNRKIKGKLPDQVEKNLREKYGDDMVNKWKKARFLEEETE